MQGYSEGNANYVRGENIGHCKNTRFIWACVEFWMVTEIVLSESTNVKALWMAI